MSRYQHHGPDEEETRDLVEGALSHLCPACLVDLTTKALAELSLCGDEQGNSLACSLPKAFHEHELAYLPSNLAETASFLTHLLSHLLEPVPMDAS
jgi:hypothetical protein